MYATPRSLGIRFTNPSRRTVDGNSMYTPEPPCAASHKEEMSPAEIRRISRASVAEFLQRTNIPMERMTPITKNDLEVSSDALESFGARLYGNVPQLDPVLPETFIYLNYANDILSFYKEELAGERDNYVHDRALITKKNIETVLTELVNEVIASIERARSILKGEKEKETWERFLAGYASYHWMTPRYKLEELLGSEGGRDV
ncbi:hypothetical protein BC835DRAFT_1416737 [Cytidiella melzeri]|nr:hypothetical protein BC835DRAFT_1416737 [Cytidiella melzeri]